MLHWMFNVTLGFNAQIWSSVLICLFLRRLIAPHMEQCCLCCFSPCKKFLLLLRLSLDKLYLCSWTFWPTILTIL